MIQTIYKKEPINAVLDKVTIKTEYCTVFSTKKTRISDKKPSYNELWNAIYDTYVADRNHLGVKDFFTSRSPAALQEMTAVMLETARKGMWKASAGQLSALARLHTETVRRYGAACSGFVCDNARLRDFIASNVSPEAARQYRSAVAEVRAEAAGAEGKVMKREEMNATETATHRVDGLPAAAAAGLTAVGLILLIRHRRRKREA